MRRQPGPLVFGVIDAVKDQLTGMIAVEPVIDGVAFTPGLDQPSQPKFRQVLRDRRRRFTHRCCEFTHGVFVIEQTPQHIQPGPVGQHPENFNSQIDLIGRRQLYLLICAHT